MFSLVVFLSLLLACTAFKSSMRTRITQTASNSNRAVLFQQMSTLDDVKTKDNNDEPEIKVALPCMKVVGDADFEEEVLENDGLSVVFFTSSWCAPCKKAYGALLGQAGKHQTKAKFFVLDTDDNSDAPAEFNVRSIPSVLLIKNKKVVSEIVGLVEPELIGTQILKHF